MINIHIQISSFLLYFSSQSEFRCVSLIPKIFCINVGFESSERSLKIAQNFKIWKSLKLLICTRQVLRQEGLLATEACDGVTVAYGYLVINFDIITIIVKIIMLVERFG